MAVYLDSADLGEARAAAGLGFVSGFTTNPALIAEFGAAADRLQAPASPGAPA